MILGDKVEACFIRLEGLEGDRTSKREEFCEKEESVEVGRRMEGCDTDPGRGCERSTEEEEEEEELMCLNVTRFRTF